MGTNTRTTEFPEKTIKQVQLDCSRAMSRARFCPDRSEVLHIRCIDHQLESEESFGNQLWYFEGQGVDDRQVRHIVFGAVEYSTQFGLNEFVEDGVYDSEHQRERFRSGYERVSIRPSWRHPAHRWLAAALIFVTSVWLVYLLLQTMSL